ncbi:A disintegrin and metalloproteinase with like protein [Argiope bruennichi]|uniref:A disintegrin and metalloproteinase with like protein n=1 Tax=Argiope bruennichi TaxID=94029 RepID=A0A8T0EIV0_ARGBR|nr:A disintegrin and metalloproteinase with like protein [Argiope bruennichi]
MRPIVEGYKKVERRTISLFSTYDLFIDVTYAFFLSPAVPEYEIVQLRMLSKRSAGDQDTQSIHLFAFGNDIHLQLTRNEGLEEGLKTMKVLKAKSVNNTIRYKEVKSEYNDSAIPYQDTANMAAVTIRHGTDGKLQMEGTIGVDLIIKPVPKNFMLPEDEITAEFFPHSDGSRSNGSYSHDENSTNLLPPSGSAHVVLKSKMTTTSSADFIPLHAGLDQTNSTENGSGVSAHAWPEVLLIVDYDTNALHDFRDEEIRRYFLSFMNGVDLVFKNIINPKISLVFSGIIIAENRHVTPYLQSNRRVFDGEKALSGMAKYMFSTADLPVHDLAILITNLDMCLRIKETRRCTQTLAGITYIEGACHVNQQQRRNNNVAIAEDNGGFTGVLIAAHEIAHLLGALHDGLPASPSGGPGASPFPRFQDWKSMGKTSLTFTGKFSGWSRCSIEQMRYFLNTSKASCLFNNPGSNGLTDSELPGHLLSLDEQCKRQGGLGACRRGSQVCAELHCYIADGSCLPSLPAAEGSSCGDGLICHNGNCVANIY